ncbi:uncharacterized protein OCT59_007910 [Rhizophagus irregularis]|uniref:F-box domain-containing protein n=3 Tax=Rhizophagus irregularis TaxID=588596 RepID=A0A015L9Y5_RHIIW|nr:hypothetical protein GLOIN_2v1782300 [Rhizophagus irregularis DAOM 181602=DAOM 197198]EXX69366.1 hypothetical protein RirG_096860 [Rhizophagus irregularis DAOM 197198w]POG64946.1 hypothetical protein GLOIN_2v1782300 [Rhizophagus irregularis DAOM 181602=DAOM 197198]UZO16525.1 hypothetical protein OCT59_007910 [Rhizophagus irregularis]GET65221.1 hypothetical protein GLOIN_2v1782300 [Rhizophagus irregularis DAOM 181602=DAOM 197198]|eukprot:XP_025171812.1 hypothetical protein GLOIN_2v1782300 [Rhizophagus irregularis DAOM 181602=DAOM 197198]
MSCSKIFSGDLPEVTHEVIKYLQNDHLTLHSCILVNRLWCRLAISLLWENPFSIHTGNYNFIEIYLRNLNGDFKKKLDSYKVNDNSLTLNTLFNYIKFLKYLNTYDVLFSVEEWFDVAVGDPKPGNRYFLTDLSFNSVTYFKGLISMSLFKIFIDNEIDLHTLEIEDSNTYFNTCLNNILELILQNKNFFHNIRNLKLYIHNHGSPVIGNRGSQIIHSHQNLKKILLGYHGLPLYQSLLLKVSNCSNTLNTIIFFYVDLRVLINLDKVLEQLNVLESVHMIYCSSLNNGFTQQIINSSKPFKLKSLFINEISQIESLQLLLQKSGSYLENFGFGFEFNYNLSLKHQSLGLIIKYCKGIKFLNFYGFENQIVHLALNLIVNIKQNLNYLVINVSEDSQLNNNIERSSIILQNLGQALPTKLEYLCLILFIKVIDLEIFLKNSQNTFIKKLLISNNMQENNDDDNIILPYIKEYIMKEKRVEYLAIKDIFLEKDPRYAVECGDLSNLKDFVEEFKLYDIKVQNYYDLLSIVSIYYFVKNID